MSISLKKIASMRKLFEHEEDGASVMVNVSRLRELLNLAEQALWRPIEEAPKDGNDSLQIAQCVERGQRWAYAIVYACNVENAIEYGWTRFRPITPPEEEVG